MPPSVTVPQLARGWPVHLPRLLLVIATLAVMAIPMCADGTEIHELPGMTGSAVTGVSGPDHCAANLCATPSTDSGVQDGVGGPGPHRGVLMSCLLLLVAVLVAVLRMTLLGSLGTSDNPARVALRGAVTRPSRPSLFQLCVIRT